MHSVGTEKKSTTTKNFLVVVLFLLFFLSPAQLLFARGGGGGSGGGGGGGGSGGAGGAGSLAGGLVWIIIFAIIFVLTWYQQKKKIAATKIVIEEAASLDPAWDEVKLSERVREVFLKFQNDWSNFDVDSMKAYLSESYWKRMVLEMNVLKNEHRQNLMQNVILNKVMILDATDSPDNTKDTFTALISARAHDVLLDTEENKELFSDDSFFLEYWDFVRENGEWKLGIIRQATENKALRESSIEIFAKQNNFFYDPDFGWLMMPNKGVLFKKSNFKTSDINNHVVGYYREKIVEFYTFIPTAQSNGTDNYIVAQVALPIKYKDILLRKKRFLFNFAPRGLRRIETESNDFNKKFCLWAAPEDQAASFELLAPNFMEKIYELPFELNIEVVGSFLYFYARDRNGVNYNKMLEVLSWAFDEMKM